MKGSTYDLSDIAITLKYGHFDGCSRKKIWGVYAAFAGLIFAGMVLGVVMASIQQINNPDSWGSFIGTLLSIILGLSVLPAVLFILFYRNEKARKEIILWIEDAILLDAFISTIDKMDDIINPSFKFQVDFDIDGIHYTRTSEEEQQSIIDHGSPKGYFIGMENYIDKKVKILYSPKYDQVMILKDKNKK